MIYWPDTFSSSCGGGGYRIATGVTLHTCALEEEEEEESAPVSQVPPSLFFLNVIRVVKEEEEEDEQCLFIILFLLGRWEKRFFRFRKWLQEERRRENDTQRGIWHFFFKKNVFLL